MGKKKRREGRGHLSSIDTLPDEAQPDVEWALEQLRERKLPQAAILDAFNARLAAKDIEPISKSAFNRYSVRKAIQHRQLDEVRRISGELVTSLGAEGADELTIAVCEMLKLSAFQMVEGGVRDSKTFMEIARGVRDSAGAQKTSAEHRKQVEARLLAKVEKAVDAVTKSKGITAETADAIKAQILGVRKE